jgi:hypothetical protein
MFFSAFLGSTLSTPAVAQPVSSSLLQQKIEVACSFLKSLYNPSLGLVRSTPDGSIYYVASDNLLVERAISSCDSAISRAINQSISSCCDGGYDGMHEALLGVKIHVPIYTSRVYTVANSTAGKLFRGTPPTTAGGNYTVLWELHNATGIFPDCTYADVTVYTALELRREGNTTGAQHEMDCLAVMFDGKGMVDESYKDGTTSEHGIYQTYKLALYIYALQKISGPCICRDDLNLLRLQGPDGGIHTGYDQIGTYAGTQENAETTSIVVLALSAPTTPCNYPLSCIPSWIIYLYAGLAITAVGVVVTVLVLESRRRKLR